MGMPKVLVDENIESKDSVGSEATTADDLDTNIDYNDHILPHKDMLDTDACIADDAYSLKAKDMMCSSQVPSRSASVIEPEPEIQLENELSSLGPAGDELISMARHTVPLKLSDVQPSAAMVQSVKLDVEQEDVQEIANRFQRFCQESDQQEKEEKVNPGDRIFEELQGKWRDMRGGMDVTDLRPEFSALLAPL